MKTVTVQFDVQVPASATDQEIEDWVSFDVGASFKFDGDNPMADRDLNAIRGSVRVI